MTQYVINIGTFPNDGTGDPLRTAFNEVNLNFDQVFAAGPVLSNIQIANNTILTTNTNGNLVLAPNGIGVVQANVNIVPNTSNIRNLGSADRRWATVYLQYANISGNLSVGGNFDVAGDLTVGANLSVTGNIINVANIITDAKTIQLANTAGSANAANGSGITVGANDAIATFLFDSANNAWATNIGISVGGPITGTSIAVSDATIYGNTNGVDAYFTGTVNAPNLVVNNITSDDSTFVTIQDGLNVQGDITAATLSVSGNVAGNYILGNAAFMTGLPTPYANANAVAYGESGWAGNIVPAANTTYSLGNSSLWWSNIWVAGNTIYIGGVPIGMGPGNVLTVDGNAVLSNDSNTTITTTGNITADYFFGNGSQLTGLNTSSISNGNSNVDIATVDGNVTITTAGTYTWTFDDSGNLDLPVNGKINVADGEIVSAWNEDFTITVQDEEDDGWALYNQVTDGYGNTMARTRLQNDEFRISTDVQGANHSWNFDDQGRLNLPGNIQGVYGGDTSLYAYDNGSGGMVEMKTISYIGDQLLANVTIRHPNVTISTQNSAYTWTFDGTGNLNLPSEGNLVGITPNNSGYLQWVGNSSGDGFSFTTLQLVPDSTLSSEQRIIVDPTGPNHIHLRAGGTQDDSAAQLYLGGENSHFKIDNGLNPNVYATANSYKWTFGSDGNLTLPGDNVATAFSRITSLANSSGDGAGYTTLGLIPDINLTGNDQYLIIDPTAPGHIHIRAGGTQDDSGADLILGGENSYVKVTGGLNPPVYVSANSQLWTFGTDGSFQTPGDISATGNITGNYFIGNGSQLTGLPASYSDSNVATFLAAYGSNTISTTGNITAGNFIGNIQVTGNVTGTSANVTLIAGSYAWTFDNTGNFVLPGNTFAVNYANGTAVTLGGTYGNANVADFLDSLGSNAVSTTGNVTSGNVLAGGIISATGNITGGNIATAGSITATGNVTANTFIGNISLTGNIQGTSANIELVAGSYTATFDNLGVLTLPTIGGDEGGEINLGVPAANTTLSGPVKFDVYQDRIRFFESSANTKGAYIDLAQAATGVGTLLNNRVSAFVDAGTFVTMDNIKATVTTSAPRGLSLATVSGSFAYNIGGTFGGASVGFGGTALGGQTLTTTPTSSIFGWGFTVSGDIAVYHLTDTTNNKCYRITVQIGASFLNNSIIIERLI